MSEAPASTEDSSDAPPPPETSRYRTLPTLGKAWLGLAALVVTAIFAGLGPPSAGLAWFGAALAFALPLAAVTLGIAQTWRIVAARWALIAGSLGALGFYLWARGAFIIEGLNGEPIVRGHTCTEDAAFIYEDLCPDLPSDALMDAAYEVDLLWTPGSIAQAAQMIGAGWILTIVCVGALLGGFLTLLAARRKRGH